MSTLNPDPPQQRDPAFPHILDDAAPAATETSEPVQPALPGDDYLGVLAPGITANEASAGQSLDSKLQREQPEPAFDAPEPSRGNDQDDDEDTDGENTPQEGSTDIDDEDFSGFLAPDEPNFYAGRLIEPDEGAHPDRESMAVANAYTNGEDDLSAEEAAMRVEWER